MEILNKLARLSSERTSHLRHKSGKKPARCLVFERLMSEAVLEIMNKNLLSLHFPARLLRHKVICFALLVCE